MKDESRIEALEHELKILKNEIQATLLEIREQILNHYYPELRAEEPLHSHSLPIRPQVGRPGVPAKAVSRSQPEAPNATVSELEAKGQIQPFSDIFLDDLTDDDEDNAHNLINSRRPSAFDDDDDGEGYDESDDEELQGDSDEGIKVQTVSSTPRNLGGTPQTREVDFRQLKQAKGAGLSSGTSSAPAPRVTEVPAPERPAKRNEAPAPKAQRPNFAALASWVSNGVATVGKERTMQVVETYATGGKLSTDTKASLLQLIALTEDEEPATAVGSQGMLALMVGLDQILGKQ
jgi:hypothetical protein